MFTFQKKKTETEFQTVRIKIDNVQKEIGIGNLLCQWIKHEIAERSCEHNAYLAKC